LDLIIEKFFLCEKNYNSNFDLIKKSEGYFISSKTDSKNYKISNSDNKIGAFYNYILYCCFLKILNKTNSIYGIIVKIFKANYKSKSIKNLKKHLLSKKDLDDITKKNIQIIFSKKEKE
jgi:hypothetical protein